jgi:hypothetical protein
MFKYRVQYEIGAYGGRRGAGSIITCAQAQSIIWSYGCDRQRLGDICMAIKNMLPHYWDMQFMLHDVLHFCLLKVKLILCHTPSISQTVDQ